MANTTSPGALLVGSVPLPDTETVFRKCHEHLADSLQCIPDGETGPRWYFVWYQREIWKDLPHVLTSFDDGDTLRLPRAETNVYDEQVQKVLDSSFPMDVMYDKYAIESYQTFKRLRDIEKLFKPNTRFQVALPTSSNALAALILPEYRVQIEPYYNQGLVNALHNIQKKIPLSDLTIQIDMAVDIAFLEDVVVPWWNIEETSLFEGVMTRAMVLPSEVHPDVKLGFHLCYGDIEHKHYKQPENLEVVVKVIIELMKRCGRRIDYVHLPVPIDRDDASYFAALADFEQAKLETGQSTDLYLGLVHANDPEGTQRRIKAAQKVYKNKFGIATECGLGRTPVEDVEGILKIMSDHTRVKNGTV